jgi:ABC-type transport system involved in cytochrome c biogenesis permease subunit
MKKHLPWMLCAAFAAWFFSTLPATGDKGLSWGVLAGIPVVNGGRHQPFESLARNALVQIRDRYSHYDLAEERTVPAVEWLAEVLFDSERASHRKVFRVDHPELISLLKLPLKNDSKDPAAREDGKHYSWGQIVTEDNVKVLQRESERVAAKDGSQHDAFDQAVRKLSSALSLYNALQSTARPRDVRDYGQFLSQFSRSLDNGATLRETLRAKYAGREIPKDNNDPLLRIGGQVLVGADRESETGERSTLKIPLLLPPDGTEDWSRINTRLVGIRGGEPLPRSLLAWAQLGDAFAARDTNRFNAELRDYRDWMQTTFPSELSHASHEVFFNRMAPFYAAMTIYVVALLLALAYWFSFDNWLRQSSFALVGLAFAIHTVGLIYRMVLQGRPPVTNLYSSAIFIGWGAIVLGMVLERFWRNAIGLVVGSFLGFVTLVIAHNLALDGDTMEMMRAVLDTNFWLATHVVIVTLGYSSTFVAGFLAIVYVIRGVFTRGLDLATRRAMARMVYGIICFATLFSFTGTVLGGIWADQSWGRFWGWDAKENGALIIVLWNALILHARWGGLVRERGIMNLAIAGNIVTSWSWFGVNMLGVGLHSYGFLNGAFQTLGIFVISQLVLIGIGCLPSGWWRSLGEYPADTVEPSGAKTGKPSLRPVRSAV